jgi:hypothetical protein
MAFRKLAHHIDVDWLHEAYRRTRKDGAWGVDRQSAQEYAENLEGTFGRCWIVGGTRPWRLTERYLCAL